MCDRALLGAFVQEKECVDVDTLKRAAREVMAEENGKGKKVRLTGRRQAFSSFSASPSRPSTTCPDRGNGPPAASTRSRGPAALSAKGGRRQARPQRWHSGPPGGQSGPGTGKWHTGRFFGNGISLTAVRTAVPVRSGRVGRPQVPHGERRHRQPHGDEQARGAAAYDEARGDYYAVLTALDGKTATLCWGMRQGPSIPERSPGGGPAIICSSGACPPDMTRLEAGEPGACGGMAERQLALAQGRAAPAGEDRVI